MKKIILLIAIISQPVSGKKIDPILDVLKDTLIVAKKRERAAKRAYLRARWTRRNIQKKIKERK